MNKKLIIVLVAVVALAATGSLVWAKTGSGAWLGVYTQPLDQKLAKSLGLNAENGALVNEVVDDSPAERAGLKVDDVIIGVNNRAVTDSDELLDRIDEASPGDTVTVTVMRRAQKLDLSVVLENRRHHRSHRSFSWDWDAPHAPKIPNVPHVPNIPNVPGLGGYYFQGGDHGYLGVHLIDISLETASALGAADGGVLVDRVEVDSPAETAGVKPGDIIVSVNGENVRGPEDIQETVSDMDDGETAKLGLIRERKALTVEAKIEEKESNYRWSRYHDWRRGAWFDDDEDFDSEEFRSEMNDLRQELKEMQKDLKELHQRLE